MYPSMKIDALVEPSPPPPPQEEDDGDDDKDEPEGPADAAPMSMSTSTRGDAFVKIFEIVDASRWTSDRRTLAVTDLRPLLLMMDIGSCASAEKHTKVQCVTASMGDVVIEHYPRVGELLELRASPVTVGSTSLNITVTVFAHGCRGADPYDVDDDDCKEDDDDSTGSGDSMAAGPGTTKRVCEAFFTYVTTRGPNGEKRRVPPLDEGSTSETTWARTLARFRKQLIRSEQSINERQRHYTISRSEAIFESSEVVLPSHQNHMKHLFGGVVMGWMCKSVVVACVKATGLPLNRFAIRAVQRVDFPSGADVSDHLFFRPRITAVFDGGRFAEVEVMVGKRDVTASLASGAETTMNFGYFYVSGASLNADDEMDGTAATGAGGRRRRLPRKRKAKHSTRIAPFARLLGETGSFSRSFVRRLSVVCADATAMAYKRKDAMMARRHLLSGLGEPILWQPYLRVQAPLLTILSVMRLCDEYEQCSASSSDSASLSVESGEVKGPAWMAIDGSIHALDGEAIEVQLSNSDIGSNTAPPVRIEWTPGDVWGHPNTVLLRGKTVISRTKPSGSSVRGNSSRFLQDVYNSLWNRRSEWDPSLLCVHVLDRKEVRAEPCGDDGCGDGTIPDEESSVYWDVAEYHNEHSDHQARFCLLRAGSYFGADGTILPGIPSSGDAGPTSAVMASRSVRHEASSSANRVLPSGWLLRGLRDDNDDDGSEKLEITYVSEMDLEHLRRSESFGAENTDDYIICFLASMMRVWFERLATLDHCEEQNTSSDEAAADVFVEG
mmetsp:Transcript_23371/g.55321  ORF Transcript_23371/g.55321 Transcript_23371/m.55321 type:complete len:781 (-) Transcript_23371:590-2932(-)